MKKVNETSILKVRDLHSYYEESHILHGVSLEVALGEIVSLLGRNGVGKSTTLKSIIGLVKPKAGSVAFKNLEVAGLPPYKIAARGIGYVPEDRRIFPKLTVRENLQLGIKLREKETAPSWSVSRIYHLFPGLKDRENHKGRHLSGGEQQMLTIARTLMGNPDILLIDEPTEGLAPKIVTSVQNIILEINNAGIPILLVEQNMKVALRLATKIYVMSKGVIVFDGSKSVFEASDDVRKKYLEV